MCPFVGVVTCYILPNLNDNGASRCSYREELRLAVIPGLENSNAVAGEEQEFAGDPA